MDAIRTILCPTDFSSLSDRSRHLAGELAQSFEARLVLHHNLPDTPTGFLAVGWMKNEEDAAREVEREEKAAERLAQLLRERPRGVELEARLTRGPTDRSIRKLAKQLGIDLIVLGSRGHSTSRHHSLTEQLLRSTDLPILAIGDTCSCDSLVDDATAAILIAVDLDQPFSSLIESATELAAALPNPFVWLYVDPLSRASSGERLQTQLSAHLSPELLERSRVEIRHGDEAKAIVTAVGETGSCLVVMGTGRQHWLERRIARTTTEVLQTSSCPTLAIPLSGGR